MRRERKERGEKKSEIPSTSLRGEREGKEYIE